ncbi:MAG: hypothetical protein V4717_06185 [Bacteroidota bacterium]
MEDLPLFIPVVFITTTVCSIFFLFIAANFSRVTLLVVVALLLVQAFLGLRGFYLVTNSNPPRLLFLLIPPVLLIVLLFATAAGKRFVRSMNLPALTILHVIRVPVELILYWLWLHKTVPQLMTFEGRNWDIFSGISAPFIYYFGIVKKQLSKKVVIAWNVTCIALLLNIVVNAILSAPVPFQQFAFDQPNIAVLYFPFVWLPAFIVPLVLFAHLAAIHKLFHLHDSSL